MNNLHQVNQTMAPRQGRRITMYFEEMEKGTERVSPFIFALVLKEFNIHLTRRVQLRMGNHQVI